MLIDEKTLLEWIPTGSRVLDLGCGDGTLLHKLQEYGVEGYGLEIDANKITACIAKGVSVIEQNLDRGLSNFNTASYDTVIMTQSLQVLRRPDKALEEMLRIGKQAIITFPNFAHWSCRLHLAIRGKMPVSKTLPHHWFDTPNIHLSTFKDFEELCKDKGIKILNKSVAGRTGLATKLFPNLLGEIAVYRVSSLAHTYE